MASITPYGDNAYGVSVRPLNANVANAPTTMSYHGATIVVNGFIVGRIQDWNPNAYNRSNELVYEVSHVTWGRPVDRVPGISTGYEISFTRMEVWGEELEVALGLATSGRVFDDLADQDRPFTTFEYLFRGATLYRVWQYAGCWLMSANRSTKSAQGNGIVSVEGGSLGYVSRTRIL